jgi:DNA ligase-1
MKPMLASDADLTKLKFPLIASPKLDGIRALVHNKNVLTRTLKLVPNKFVQHTLADPLLQGFDGELIVGAPWAKDVYRNTVSGVMGHDGEPRFSYFVFDVHHRPDMSYTQRRTELELRVKRLPLSLRMHIVLHTQSVVGGMEQLLQYEQFVLDQGYEGLILRDPNSLYKYGRSTAKEGILLKLKRFTDSEAEIIGFEEQMHNGNAAETNELGRTKRSTAKAGLSGKNTLGALIVRDLKTGIEFNIGTGFDDAVKQYIWDNRANGMKGQIVKYKYFAIGVKDAPRHPVFLGFRDRRDM